MADTNIPNMNSKTAISKQEANRSQQAAQKAEMDKQVSDYDTGDHVAFCQDILNPNLHYGLLNEAELEMPETQNGPADSNGNGSLHLVAASSFFLFWVLCGSWFSSASAFKDVPAFRSFHMRTWGGALY